MLLVFGAPCQLRSLAGQEHGRTIPFADMGFDSVRRLNRRAYRMKDCLSAYARSSLPKLILSPRRPPARSGPENRARRLSMRRTKPARRPRRTKAFSPLDHQNVTWAAPVRRATRSNFSNRQFDPCRFLVCRSVSPCCTAKKIPADIHGQHQFNHSELRPLPLNLFTRLLSYALPRQAFPWGRTHAAEEVFSHHSLK